MPFLAKALIVGVTTSAVLTAHWLGGTASGPSEPVDRASAPLALRVVTKLGHPTHPTWYHDALVAPLGDRVTVAWNGDREVGAAQLRASDLEIIAKTKLSVRSLGGAKDTTATDTDRHDVPAVFPDASGRLHFLYGGGSIAGHGPRRPGPLLRTTLITDGLTPLGPERALNIGGGAAFDFEGARDRGGTWHIFGQHGRGNTGSLIELRLRANGTWARAREIIHGGFRRRACRLHRRARGCNRFAIARVLADPGRDRLHLVWGYSEASLSGKCHTDAGYCDHDLYYATSDDHGATWHNAGGSATVRVRHRTIAHDDRRFRVSLGNVGLFKALAVGPDGPLIAYTQVEDDEATLYAQRMRAGRWERSVIARPGEAGVRSWSGSLVLRADRTGYALWVPTGTRIIRFRSVDGGRWSRTLVYRGPAWSLVGVPALATGEEILVWRGKLEDGHRWVMAARVRSGG